MARSQESIPVEIVSSTRAIRQLREAVTRAPLNPKRLSGSGGVDSWYPYYAGFSSQFASAVLSNFSSVSHAVLLDPWNGGGTTTFVGSALGFQSIGIDLNPFAGLIASAKLARFPDMREAQSTLTVLARCFNDSTVVEVVEELSQLEEWFTGRSARLVSSLIASFSEKLGQPAPGVWKKHPPAPEAAFYILCLVLACRNLAFRRLSNPTWVRPSEPRSITRRALRTEFLKSVRQRWSSLNPLASKASSQVKLLIADARFIPLSPESVDLVLTSPPYCTRIDYAISTSFELAILGLLPGTRHFAEFRRSLMGTTAIRGGDVEGRPILSKEVSRLLDRVASHPSYASSGYYLKNISQYFRDAELALEQIARVMKQNAVAFLVLQTSYYKNIEIDLPCLYVDMARSLGLRGEILCELPVQSFFAKINKNATRHLSSRAYRESVILLQK